MSQATHKKRRSDVAAWCRGFDCRLDDKLATISGWDRDFATVTTLEQPSYSQEFSWEAVDRVMRNGRRFKS